MMKMSEDYIDLNRLAFEKIQPYSELGFRDVTQILGVNFHLSREQTFQLIKQWKKKKWVRIIPYHGIKILKKTKL